MGLWGWVPDLLRVTKFYKITLGTDKINYNIYLIKEEYSASSEDTSMTKLAATVTAINIRTGSTWSCVVLAELKD